MTAPITCSRCGSDEGPFLWDWESGEWACEVLCEEAS